MDNLISKYGKDYYSHYRDVDYGDAAYWQANFKKIAQSIFEAFHPKTFLDVGCAFGYLVAALRDLGVEAYGLDVSDYAISQCREDIRPFCHAGNILSGIPSHFPKHFDCISTIEVIEHLHEEDAQSFIHTICSHTNQVVFSSTPDDDTEPTHYNVQQMEYWAKRFAQEGFFRKLDIGQLAISPQTMVFTNAQVDTPRLVEEYEQHLRLDHANLSSAIEEKDCHIQKQNKLIKEQGIIIDDNLSKLQLSEKENRSLNEELDSLREQNSALSEAYNAVINSHFWRWSRPLRKVMGKVKRILAAVPGTRRVYHFLKRKKAQHQNASLKLSRRDRQYLQDNFPGTSLQVESYAPFATLKQQHEHRFKKDYKISVLVPIYNTPKQFLKEMIDSVRNQTYSNWELCLADASDSKFQNEIEGIVRKCSEQDNRIRYQKLSKNEGIAGNTNAAMKMASGDFCSLLDHDDILHPCALFEIVKCLNEKPNTKVIYTDENRLRNGVLCSPFYKPDWSPDLLYSQNYICHLLTFKRDLLPDGEVFRSAYDGAQDYDLILRLSETTNHIEHIPMCLYGWREHDFSTAKNADSKPYANEAGRKALDEYLKRKYNPRAYAELGKYEFTYVPRFKYLLENNPLISIIIPMKDNASLTEICIHSILEKSSYQNYEIIILDNRSEKPETKAFFEKIKATDPRIRIEKADFSFNWSALNNFGAQLAKGEVFVFMNNDMRVITTDWLERLAENALRPDIGVVGALLLYPDDSIQHAGVVIGMNHWADHVFKGQKPIHTFMPFVSPVLSRNVSAVTGACQAVSRSAYEKIGNYNEEFIICGSDVEYCIRANRAGLNVLYNAETQLYHDESKSRTSYIPQKDFDMSDRCYEPYRVNGDPYYNKNLNINSTTPISKDTKKAVNQRFEPTLNEKDFLNEVRPFFLRKDSLIGDQLRLNLLVPSIKTEHVFGGIATAIRFFESLSKELNIPRRLITVDIEASFSNVRRLSGYIKVNANEDSEALAQVVSYSHRSNGETIPVGKNDIFIATAWWTAYTVEDVLLWQNNTFGKMNTLTYLIQDYEPNFYPWSSHFSMAESTYHLSVPTFAIFNSYLLKEYFDLNHYKFEHSSCFDANMNQKLLQKIQNSERKERKKQIIIYGRPSTPRNCFELAIKALKYWCENMPDHEEWVVYSVGETHPPVQIGNDLQVRSLGKLSLDQYADIMLESYAAISLMVSPHPSYPPLEMSTFGIKTITNCFGNKDLNGFNENIISVPHCAPKEIGKALVKVCMQYPQQPDMTINEQFCSSQNEFDAVLQDAKAIFSQSDVSEDN